MVAIYNGEGNKIRYAEAFQICEYGMQPDEKMKKIMFPF